jgi:hypothetical protein
MDVMPTIGEFSSCDEKIGASLIQGINVKNFSNGKVGIWNKCAQVDHQYMFVPLLSIVKYI